VAEGTRIRATHVGSLPRSPALNEINLKQMTGEDVDDATYEGLVNEAGNDVVRHQVDAGIDGERRRAEQAELLQLPLRSAQRLRTARPSRGQEAAVGAMGFEGERFDHPDSFEGLSRIGGTALQQADPSAPPPQAQSRCS